MTAVVTFHEVYKRFGEREVLKGASFTIEKGTFNYLIGRTGAGKSTVLRLIYADLKPDKGSIKVDKFYIERLSDKEIPFLRRRLGIVFQDFQLLTDRSVEQNLLFVMRATGWRDKKRMRYRLTEVLMKVGLTHKAQAMPHELSGGEQQRVAIARALVNDPILLIADEPTGNLDPETSDEIIQLLQTIQQQGTTVLMATHEYEIIKQFPGNILRIQNGIIEPITLEKLLS